MCLLKLFAVISLVVVAVVLLIVAGTALAISIARDYMLD